jgi:hypothetical protein
LQLTWKKCRGHDVVPLQATERFRWLSNQEIDMNATSKHSQRLWPVVAGTLVAVLAAMAQPAHAGLLGGGGGLSGGASGHAGGALGGNLGGLGQRPDLSRGRDALEGTRDRADRAAGKVGDRAQQAGGKLKDGADQATGQVTDRAHDASGQLDQTTHQAGALSAEGSGAANGAGQLTASRAKAPTSGDTATPATPTSLSTGSTTPSQAAPSKSAQGSGSVNATGSSQAQRDTRGVSAQGGVSVEAKGQASKQPGQ